MMITALIVIGAVVGGALAALVAYLLWPLRYPFTSESDYSHHTFPWWQLNYAHKYLRPRRRAAKGSGLERHFAELDFSYGDPGLADQRVVTLRAVGDLMCRRDMLGRGGEHLWDEVGAYFFGADLSVGNLEFAVNPDWVIEKTIRYSVPGNYAEPLLADERFGEIGFVSVGNNHVNDSLGGGVRSTVDYLEERGIPYAGANRTPEEQDSFPIVEVGGAKIALLAYSFSTNGIPLDPGFEHGVNVVRFNALDDGDYDPSLILRHVELARERGADYIVSNHHWCIDLEYYPPPRIVERTRQLFEAGIDLILGHHPHVLNPVDRHRTADGRECLAFYSLGSLTTVSLIFPWQRLSAVAGLDLAVGTDSDGRLKVTPRGVEMTPVYHAMIPRDGIVDNRVVPVRETARAVAAGETPSWLTPKEARRVVRMAREFDDHFVQRGIRYR